MTRQKLLYRSTHLAPGRTGAVLDLSAKALGWSQIHFAVRHLTAGAAWSGLSRREERCLVLLRGYFEVSWSTGSARVGPRADVFGGYPHAIYLPRNTAFRVVALEACEIADCRAPSARAFEPRVIRPEDCGYEIRGGGNATRQIVDIMPPGFPAERLLLCEVFTPGGNWSSYPPHKHDTDNPPREVDLEEVYYFRYKDADGYGFQRVYNGRRDDTLRVGPRRCRRRARRISPVCYSLWLRCLLSECPGRRSPIDGRQRRSPIREIPAQLAAARSAAAAGAAAGRRRTSRVGSMTGGVFPMTRYETQSWRNFMKRTLHGMLALVAVCLLFAPNAFAQVDRAAVSGTVKDSSDAVVPGATVTTRNVATNVSSTSVTDSQGAYAIGGLIPGSYVVDVELAGFNKSSRNVELQTGQRARIDFALAVGSVEQNVTVQASSPIINTEQATLGTVISKDEVSKLPLSLRNWDDLLALVAGVQSDRYTEQAGGTSSGRTGGVNVHGNRARCRTTSCSTASPTTASRRTCRS